MSNATASTFGILPVSPAHLALKAARVEHTKALAEMTRVAEQVRRAVDRGEATLKPALAAKMAFSRAMRAWGDKKTEGGEARDTIRATMRERGAMDSAEYARLSEIEKRCLEVEAPALFERARAIYLQAQSQGWTNYSHDARWHFGEHATRDLIMANID